MTHALGTTGGRLARMRLYRRLMFGAIGAGVIFGLLLRYLEYPLLGEVVYLAGFLAFLGIWLGTDITLFDEREQRIEEWACASTLTITAFALILGASAGRLLPILTGYSYAPWVHHALYAFVAQFALFGGVYLWLRYRP